MGFRVHCAAMWRNACYQANTMASVGVHLLWILSVLGIGALPARATEFTPEQLRDIRSAFLVANASQLVYGSRPDVEAALKAMGVTQQALLPRENPRLLIASIGSHTLLAFRGTAFTRDWLTNTSIFQRETELGPIHSGFWRAWEEVQGDVERFVAGLKPGPDNRPHVIWVGGHSMGGAIATIAGMWLKKREQPNRWQLRGVFTYGQPRVASLKIAADMKSNPSAFPAFHRYVIGNDLVTMLPNIGYAHLGEPRFHKRIRELQPSPLETTAEQESRLLLIGKAIRERLPTINLGGVGAYLPSVGDLPVDMEVIRKHMSGADTAADAALIREHPLANYVKVLASMMALDNDSCTVLMSTWITGRKMALPECASRQWFEVGGN